MEIPLRAGPLRAKGYKIHCSGVVWLCEPGQMCRANQVIAYFNLSLEPTGSQSKGLAAFAGEMDLQVACAPRVGGRIQYDTAAVPGGFLSFMGVSYWNDDAVVARLEIEDTSTDPDTDAGRLRLLMLAGRRMTPVRDTHTGLLPGFHGRVRGWWCEDGETPITLLSMGVCDVNGITLGEQDAFLEMFRDESAPSHFVFIPDHPVAPSVTVLLDQLERSTDRFQLIAADLNASLLQSKIAPTANDLMFAGMLLSVLERCPIRETYDVLSPSGLLQSGPAEAVLLSLNSESPSILRHKKLGYRLHFLQHHLTAAGPAVRNWLATAFEGGLRTTEDIKVDYEKLIGAIGKSTGAHVIVLNRMSTSGQEDVSTYAPFDVPLSATLANISSKELNLMVHDLASNGNVSILDMDAIAAEIGGGQHLPDGVHQSKVLQDILRKELQHILQGIRAPGVPVKSLQTRPA
jgi:hypothetical protein